MAGGSVAIENGRGGGLFEEERESPEGCLWRWGGVIFFSGAEIPTKKQTLLLSDHCCPSLSLESELSRGLS